VSNIYKYSNFSNGASFKDLDIKKGIVTGYFSSFDTIDSYKELVKKGAFKKTIAENFSRIKHLQNHNTSQPLGKLQKLSEDTKGLYYESKIGNHNLGVDFLKMVDSELITEHSIGYAVTQYKQREEFLELTEIRLWEGSSLTAWGVNENTPLTGLKSIDGIDFDSITLRVKALEKFCKNSDATDETIELLLIEQKQLAQILMDLKPNTHTEQKSNVPFIETAISAIQLFNFKNTL
jgi:HK97 family phage prohead protease